MKIIEALKLIKANKEKIADLQLKIGQNCANYSNQPTPYGDKVREVIAGWLQACEDIGKENIKLAIAIQKTNLATMVNIKFGDVMVEKSIAEWILRRTTYSVSDLNAWNKLGSNNMRPEIVKTGQSESPYGLINVVYNYDVKLRDRKMEVYRSEPHLINAALEIVNATTDLIE